MFLCAFKHDDILIPVTQIVQLQLTSFVLFKTWCYGDTNVSWWPMLIFEFQTKTFYLYILVYIRLKMFLKLTPLRYIWKKNMLYNLPHSGKFVPTTNKSYANFLSAQARVWTTQKLFSDSAHPKKESCYMSENFYYCKTKHISLSKNAGSTVPNNSKTS